MAFPENPKQAIPKNLSGQWTETAGAPTPDPGDACSKDVSGAFVRATRVSALLQRAMPEGGAVMVAVEGPGEIPGHGGREAGNGTGKAGATGSGCGTENHPTSEAVGEAARVITKDFFSTPVVTWPGCLRGVQCAERRSPRQRFLLARVPAWRWSAVCGARAALAADTRRLSRVPQAAIGRGGGNGAAS